MIERLLTPGSILKEANSCVVLPIRKATLRLFSISLPVVLAQLKQKTSKQTPKNSVPESVT